jgi:hypothetical protein
MFGFGAKQKEALERAVKEQVGEIVGNALADATAGLGKLKQIGTLEKKVVSLKEELRDLEIGKKAVEADHAEETREIEHKIGLEKKRQEFETDTAKREAIVAVKEENLEADKARFENQMEFIQNRFSEEVGYLKEIVGQVLSCVQGIAKAAGVSKGDDG